MGPVGKQRGSSRSWEAAVRKLPLAAAE